MTTQEKATHEEHDPAGGDVAEVIARICGDCLGVAELDADDNLVRMGVDSLLAAEVISRIELEFGVDVVAEFFAQPTIRHLTEAVEQHLAAMRSR